MSVLFVFGLKDRGDIFWEHFGNFQEGLDWTRVSLGAGHWTVINFGFASTAWGSILCSHSERIRHKGDCYIFIKKTDFFDIIKSTRSQIDFIIQNIPPLEVMGCGKCMPGAANGGIQHTHHLLL